MRFIENADLREWVKDNLRKAIFQKVGNRNGLSFSKILFFFWGGGGSGKKLHPVEPSWLSK